MNVEKLTEKPQGKSVGSSSSGSALLSALSFVCECRKIEPEKLTLNEREMVALADERDRLRALLCDAVGALDSRLLAAWGSDLEERICRELEPNTEMCNEPKSGGATP